EEFAKQWRDDFSLDSVIVNLPGTGARKYGNTRNLTSEGKVHRKTVASDQQAMVAHIGQMLEQRGPLGQVVYCKSISFQPHFQFFIVSPFFHRPNRSGFGCNRNVSGEIGHRSVGKHIGFTTKSKPKPAEDQVLIAAAILIFQLIRALPAKFADEA